MAQQLEQTSYQNPPKLSFCILAQELYTTCFHSYKIQTLLKDGQSENKSLC